MHNAPSVSYPVGRSRLAAALLAAAWFGGTIGVAVWIDQVHPAAIAIGAAAAAVLGSGAAAVHGWMRSPQGLLAWNGEGWTWKAGPVLEPGEPHCVLDLQHTMLLRWHAQGVTRWLWTERRADAVHWGDLRRAVYSRARSGPAQRAHPEPEPRP